MDKKRLFVDMDGTLAKFHPVEKLETLYEEGYFYGLDPIQNVVEAVRELVQNHRDEIEVFILTACLSDSIYAVPEKKEWLDLYLPEINRENRIFTVCGEDKKMYVPGGIRETDYLLDDYTKNLTLWQPPARGIKLLNGINHTNETWENDRLSYDKNPINLAADIIAVMNGREIRDPRPEEQEIVRDNTMTQEEVNEKLQSRENIYEEMIDFSKQVLVGIDFQGQELWNADFTGAVLRECNFRYTDLTKAKMRGTDLRGADFYYANIEKCVFEKACAMDTNFNNARLCGSKMTDTDFTGSKMQGTYFDEAYLHRAIMKNVDASDSYLDNADFTEADLSGSVLRNCSVNNACFDSADLKGAVLHGIHNSVESGVSFRHANLSNTSFQNADLHAPDFYSVVRENKQVERRVR